MKKTISVVLLCLFFQMLGADESSFQTIGTLLPSSYCRLGSQVSGRVEKIFVETGDFVEKGQALLVLDTQIYAIDLAQKQAALELAQLDLFNAERDLQRMQSLWNKPQGQTPCISKKKFEDAQSLYNKAFINLRQSQEALKRSEINMEESTLRSPFEGVITKRNVEMGENISQSPVLEVAAVNPLYLEFSIPQKYLTKIKVGQKIHFQMEGYEREQFESQIDRIFPAIDENNRSVKCRAIIPNPDHLLKPGSLAKIEINL